MPTSRCAKVSENTLKIFPARRILLLVRRSTIAHLVRGAGRTTDPPPVLLLGIDIGERTFIRDLEIAFRRRVRAHHGLRAFGGIRAAELIEERPIDEQRMAMTRTPRRPHDARVR